MRPDARQRGFGLVAAMFVIIIVAAVIAAMAQLAGTQNATNSMSIQQARAYQMACAGLEWGIARAVSKESCDAIFTLEGFAVTVSCGDPIAAGQIVEETCIQSGVAVTKHVLFHEVDARAEYGLVGNPDYAYRRLSAVVELPCPEGPP